MVKDRLVCIYLRRMPAAIFRMLLLFVLMGVLSSASGEPLCQKCRCEEEYYRWSYTTELQLGFVVDCSGRDLTEIPSFSDWQGEKVIKKLDLSSNKITNIPCNAFAALSGKVIGISMKENQIDDIRNVSICAFSGIENELEDLDFTSMFRESPDDILSNEIWEKLKNLKGLTLSGCNLPVLGSKAFAQMPGLTKLDISWNNMGIPDGKAFEGLDNLVWLGIGHTFNNLPQPVLLPKELFSSLKNLQYLDLDGNDVSIIPANSFSATQLKVLELDRLDLQNRGSVHDDAFVGIEDTLQELSFYHSGLNEIPVKALEKLKKLKILDFNSNVIRIIPKGAFETLENLKELRLDHNPANLTVEGFIGMGNRLEMLAIRKVYSKAEGIQLEAIRTLKALEWLDLSYSGYEYLLNDTFYGISARRLTLSGMKISRIEKGVFSGLKGPLQAELSNNKIEDVSWVTDPCFFRTLELDGNPIQCDCDMYRVLVSLRSQGRLYGECMWSSQNRNISFESENDITSLVKVLRAECDPNGTIQSCPSIEDDRRTSVASITHSSHSLIMFFSLFLFRMLVLAEGLIIIIP